MFKKTGQLWLLFAMCLLLIVPAMIWVSMKAVQLDNDLREDRRQTELARREAEAQERITSALYRMDWRLGPVIAREVARPHDFYSTQPANDQNFHLAEPQAEFVKLYFQLDDKNRLRLASKINGRMGIVGKARQLVTFDELNEQLTDADSIDSQNLAQTAGNQYLNRFVLQSLGNQSLGKGVETELNATANSAAPVSKPQSKFQMQQMRNQSRGGKEFAKRQQALGNDLSQQQQSANGPVRQLQQSQAAQQATPQPQPTVGIMQPFWFDNELLLVRSLNRGQKKMLQCCWLDWEKIQNTLREEVNDLLPQVDFLTISNQQELDPARSLVTLPVQLDIPAQPLIAATALGASDGKSLGKLSGIRVAIGLAWAGILLSALATAMLLRGLVQLSERRAAFVSAVTHELRTPLTTFKMYSEMLANKMVPPEKQTQYAETLSNQADRLCHLVENVLQFARLERGPGKPVESSTVAELLSGVEQRLIERVSQAGMELEFQVDGDVLDAALKIEPHILEQILFNLVDNACKYARNAANRRIEVRGQRSGGNIEFTVRDFGPGIGKDISRKLFEPFRKSDLEAANSEPGVGLGMALCKRMALSAGGTLQHDSVNPGARFRLQIRETA